MLPMTLRLAVASAAALAGAALADDFALDWWTVDAGGELWSSGGAYALSGTIGQPDAGAMPMAGGAYELVGGFWPVMLVGSGFQVGDLNCDGAIDAFDIDPFVLALTATAPDYPEYYAQFPDCDVMLADINGDGAINAFDIDPFVQLLVGGRLR